MELSEEQKRVYEEAEKLNLTIESPIFKPLFTYTDHSRKYRLMTDDGPVFLKWAETELGKTTILHEIPHVKLLDSVGVSPKLVSFSEEHHSYATEWIGGSDGAELDDEKRLEIFWQTISRIRGIDPALFSTQGWDKFFLFKMDPADPNIPEDLPKKFKKSLESAYYGVRELKGVDSIHSDFHTGNIIYKGSKLYVIDPEHMQTGVGAWDLVYYLGYDDAGMSAERRAKWLSAHVVEEELKLILEYLLSRGYTWAATDPKRDKRGTIVERGRKNIQLALPVYENLFGEVL